MALGYDLMRTTKNSGAAQTALTIATADDSKLTPPAGAFVAISGFSIINSAAITSVTIQDGATVIMRFIPDPAGNQFAKDFSWPLQITTSTNDLRLVAAFTSGTAQMTVWYKYIF